MDIWIFYTLGYKPALPYFIAQIISDLAAESSLGLAPLSSDIPLFCFEHLLTIPHTHLVCSTSQP